MSVSSYLDIILVKTDNEKFSTLELIKNFLKYGWILEYDSEMTYLPVGDINDFNWISEKMKLETLVAILKEKESKGEFLGVCMTWKDTKIGGSFLIYDSGKISISLIIDRKTFLTENNFKITDINWYLMKILPILDKKNFVIESFSYEEHI